MTARILVVEDNEIERLGVSRLLSLEGYKVTDAANGELAVECMLKSIPDLIILDMMMPDFDGWQFLALRKANPIIRDVPVVIVTGASYTNERWATGLGAQAFLHKPFPADALLETVKQLTTMQA